MSNRFLKEEWKLPSAFADSLYLSFVGALALICPHLNLFPRAQQETSIVIWLSESAAESNVVKMEAGLSGMAAAPEAGGCIRDRSQRESPVSLF